MCEFKNVPLQGGSEVYSQRRIAILVIDYHYCNYYYVYYYDYYYYSFSAFS